MTGEVREEALARLIRALGLGEDADEEALGDLLDAAEEDILRYLNCDELPELAAHLLVELAALKYCRGQSGAEWRRSASYSEGQIAQSETYLTAQEVQAGEQALLQSLAPYRRVACKGAGA